MGKQGRLFVKLNSAEEARILRVIPEKGGEHPAICMCGRESPHAKRTDTLTVHPGTPWWEPLADAEVGDLVVVRLPKGELHLKVQAIDIEGAPPDCCIH